MNFKLTYDIALSLLTARWKQTLVAAVGVMFSITMFIALLSFMGGLNHLLDSLIVNRTPHIRLYNQLQQAKKQPLELYNANKKSHNFISSIKPKDENEGLRNANKIVATLKKDTRVEGIAPKLIAQVFYNVGRTDVNGLINGIDIEEESRLFFFKDYVVDGNPEALKTTPNSIILGKGAAEKMLTSIGDVIQVTSAAGEQMQLKVVGFYQSGLKEVDDVQSFTSVITTQKLLGKPNTYITDIQIKLKDLLSAPRLAKEYSSLFDVDAIDIQSANSQFDTGSNIRTTISYSVGITLLVVAGFGIYNILNMMIYEKIDSIAILKATGFSGNDVRNIFNIIALSIGIAGGFAGLLAGLGLSGIIDQIPFQTSALPTVTTYPVEYNPRFYIIGALFSVLTTYMAGYLPSRKASKIDPVIIIRGK